MRSRRRIGRRAGCSPRSGRRAANTLVVAAGDHGEAFGEHGEYAHSIFVYDTTLRVPLLMSGPGVPAGLRVADPVTLADVAPTVTRALGAPMTDVDGIDLSPVLRAHDRFRSAELYAESFAPLVEFGWAPLRAVRSGAWKLIAAPKPELFDVEQDPGEQTNAIASQPDVARRLDARVSRYSTDSLNANGSSVTDDAAQRLRALGYSSGSQSAIRNPQSAMRARSEGSARAGRAHRAGDLGRALRCGAARGARGHRPRRSAQRPGAAAPRLRAAAGRRLRARGAGVSRGRRGRAADAPTCISGWRTAWDDGAISPARSARWRKRGASSRTTRRSSRTSACSRRRRATSRRRIQSLSAALAVDPNLHEARFNLALTLREGRDGGPTRPRPRGSCWRVFQPNAPQRPEVERLLKAVQ